MNQCPYFIADVEDGTYSFWRCQKDEHGQVGHEAPPNSRWTGEWFLP
jgi:hypothetical protein